MEASVIQAWMQQRIAELLELQTQEIDPMAPIEGFGLGSLDAAELVGELQVWLKIKLSATLMYEHENINTLAVSVAQACSKQKPAHS
jgi:acyl carrier protein